MNDAINLSWTTFSTVGYGMISPTTSAVYHDIENGSGVGTCAVMSTLLSFESLVGILFVSFAAAILFVKLIQFQSNAQVKFSTVMIVKYGEGVDAQDIDDPDDDDEEEEEEEEGERRIKNQSKKETLTPCPILIFRIVNLLHSSRNGEIVNAHVNTVATVDLKNAVMSTITRSNAVFRNALNAHIEKKKFRSSRFSSSSKRNYYSSYLNFNNKNNRFKDSDRFGVTSSVSTASTGSAGVLSDRSNDNRAVRFQNFLSISKFNPTETTRTISTPEIRTLSTQTQKKQRLRSSMMHLGISERELGLKDDDVLSTIKSVTSHESNESDDYDHGEHYVSKEMKNQQMDEAEALHLSAVLGRDIAIHNEQVDMPNLVFAKVIMTPVHHPYFRTSWRVVHTLNEESPLLSKSMRNKIKNNKGYWPRDMYTPGIIKDSIDFDQFLVSFRGMSKSSGTDVYAHQVYKKEDLRIGYQFSSILVQNPNGSIGVEPDYIDELKVQDGGRYPNLDR